MCPIGDTVGPVKEFALTGGIGSGKSTVAALLVARGAVLIDDDAIVRELQRPGEPVFDTMVERWGPKIVREDGELDRAAVADIVFNDADELAAINAIVHPAVADESERRRAALADTAAVVIRDIPLLVLPGGELAPVSGLDDLAGIIVVDAPIESAIERVVEHRGLDAEDVAARIAAQATRDDRRGVADFVIDNQGTLGDLAAQVDRCWEWIESLEPAA